MLLGNSGLWWRSRRRSRQTCPDEIVIDTTISGDLVDIHEVGIILTWHFNEAPSIQWSFHKSFFCLSICDVCVNDAKQMNSFLFSHIHLPPGLPRERLRRLMMASTLGTLGMSPNASESAIGAGILVLLLTTTAAVSSNEGGSATTFVGGAR